MYDSSLPPTRNNRMIFMIIIIVFSFSEENTCPLPVSVLKKTCTVPNMVLTVMEFLLEIGVAG